ncbi:MAG: hydrogenase iron-sulfur subunit [Defluviitaleaceae bacterium]|nr:hydrogenase iron-sulfur subunit [Defluviitaleaceae bacterium]
MSVSPVKIVAFCCNWCSYAGADLAGTSRLQYPAQVKVIRVPCSCRVDETFILRAFGRGADGVIVCGCHIGDCHYATGNYHTQRRVTQLFALLEFMGMEKNRLRLEWISAAEGAKFAETMGDFVAQVEALGKNERYAGGALHA